MVGEKPKWRHGAEDYLKAEVVRQPFRGILIALRHTRLLFRYICRTRPKAPYFEIHEQQEDGRLRLELTGELDLVSSPVLENRLEQLHAGKQSVCLDLSALGFMDSTGIHLLIGAFNHAREDGWQFEVDPALSPQVEDLFRLTDVERITGGHRMNGHH